MKRLIKRLVKQIVHLWSRVYTYERSLWWQGKRNALYTAWIRPQLGSVGERSRFAYPLRLQGGGRRCIHIGSKTSFGSLCVLGCWIKYGKGDDVEHYKPEIHIGNDCSIGEYCHITAINRITIGDGLLTGRFVYIGDNAHGGLSMEEADTPPAQRHLTSKGEIRIGRNVWLGDKVTVLGGVTIGDNVIVGAGSIVTHDLPSNCLAAGAPAKVVRTIGG